MRKGLPCYEEAFTTAVELIPFGPEDEIRVLDLGAGTGLFAWHVTERFRRANLVLYDVSSKMLEVARARFGDSLDRVSIVEADYRGLDAVDAYDVAVSSLSIHHLAHTDKEELFRQVYLALRPGGVFINLDQIEGSTQGLRDLYWETWLEKVRASGADEGKVQESISRRRELDNDASLADQLCWLSGAGFTDVDCIYKHYFVGVFYGLKQQPDNE